MTDNYYHILGLENFAAPQEIKAAYRRLAKKYHPDRNPDKPQAEDIFKRVYKAYQVLSHPEQKIRFDQHLKHALEKPYGQPHYAPRKKYYTTEKKQYTAKAWMYGRLFIIGFVVTIIVIPLTLFHVSSIKAYERGIAAYLQGDKHEALINFNQAMMYFGGRSVEAGIKGAEISIYDLDNPKRGHYFISRGMKFAKKQKDYARLHYLKAKAYEQQEAYQMALNELHKADSLNYSRDSIELETGLLLAFGLRRYAEAETRFDYLIENNVHPATAWFGKAWCQQQLGSTEKAVNGYSKVIAMDSENAVAYYYRGVGKITLADTLAACYDFKIAMRLGYTEASGMISEHCLPSDQ